MTSWLLWFCLVTFVVAAVGLVAWGSTRWANATRALARRLEAARNDDQVRPPTPTRYDSRELEGLPAPVQRYFRAALKEGQPIVEAVTVELAGSFNMSTTDERWKPFTSRQRIVTRRPGFLWDAQVAMFPGVCVRVADSYIAGEGRLRASILGLCTVADDCGGGEIARGEFLRYFAETAWYPTALLPSQGVRWEPVDEASANATIADGPLTSTLLFKFNEAGLIDAARAAARGAMVGKDRVMLPWEGRWSDYQARDGMMVPIRCEAAWLRPEGRKPYFRGTVTFLSCEFSP
jgi:hypothetical protein